MPSMLFVVLYFAFCAAVVAQSSLSIVCVAGQCFQGYSNTTIGATLSGSELTQRIQLLPGQYTTTTNPQLLHDLLTSRSSTLVGSVGFESASLSSLPLSLQLEPGVAMYSHSLYSGQASFAKLPESPVDNSSVPLSGNSIAIAPDVWIAVSNNNRRLILWDSVPDISQLPSTGSLSLLDVQSSVCSPPCSGTGVCSASGTCICPTGYSGSACESCEDGFFGPTCEPCPDDCSNCDQGMSGSGRCLPTTGTEPDSLPANCNCLNGLCGSDGQCTCLSGWTTADNGTACAKCAPGFFLSTTGDCQVCSLGCDQCTDGTGDCVTCKTGFTQDADDKTRCTGVPTTRSTTCSGAECNTPCPDGTFGQGAECLKCFPFCYSCNGPTEKDCTLCIGGAFFFNGVCLITDSDGVCQGGNGMIANRIKDTCDSCGAKCTSCKIPNFYQGSTFDQLQCTDCLPGSFLFEGKCVAACPTGMFAPEGDNVCTSCSSSCSTCAGSPDFCLTCPNGQIASSGKCISTCPSDSISSSGSCVKCHPDCSTCTGPSFDQCSSCSPSRPVLTAGRCLSTCSKNQFLDTATSTCGTCDPSCSSCSGPGSRNCLGCSSLSQVLRGGSCVAANCRESSGVIPGLGVCLSELVEVPSPSPSLSPPVSQSPSPAEPPSVLPSDSGSPSPLPTVTGLTDPTATTSTTPINPRWWQILLIAVGCAFLFLVVICCWRWRARRHREKRTETFARQKNLDGVHGWLVRLGQRLFRGKRNDMPSELSMAYAHESLHSPKIRPIEDDIVLSKLAPPKSATKEATRRDSMDDFISSYERSPTGEKEKEKSRIDQNSHSLHPGKQRSASNRREFSQRNPPPAFSRRYPWNNEGMPIHNRFNLSEEAYIRAILPTIAGDMAISSQSHQSTLSRFPSYIIPGAVPQHTVGNRTRMPVTSAGYGQGLYMLPPHQQFQSRAPNAHNPFRHRGP